MNRIKKVIFILRIFLLKRKANRLARKTGVQHFIVKFGGEVTIMSKSTFKYMRQHGYFPLSFTATELKNIALYYTKKRQ